MHLGGLGGGIEHVDTKSISVTQSVTSSHTREKWVRRKRYGSGQKNIFFEKKIDLDIR